MVYFTSHYSVIIGHFLGLSCMLGRFDILDSIWINLWRLITRGRIYHTWCVHPDHSLWYYGISDCATFWYTELSRPNSSPSYPKSCPHSGPDSRPNSCPWTYVGPPRLMFQLKSNIVHWLCLLQSGWCTMVC